MELNMGKIANYINNISSNNILEIIYGILIILIFNILSPIISYIIVRLVKSKSTNKKDIKETYVYMVLKSFFRVFGIYIAIIYLKPIFNISENVMIIITKIFKIMVILTIANVLANSMSIKSKLAKTLEKKLGKKEETIDFILKIIRGLIYIIAIFMAISEIGYDLSGLVTGLGLSGVVITLAAQDTAKNLFGGLMIFLDKPFKVGNYIKFKEYEGIVEDISFRSTKVRTLENSLLHIPNSEITSDVVINTSEIKKRRYKLDLIVVLDTDLRKLNELAKQINQLLIKDENVLNETITVRFTEIVSSGLNLQIVVYINIKNYKEFLVEKEKINYNIMKIVKDNNIELAYDTQTIEIKQ